MVGCSLYLFPVASLRSKFLLQRQHLALHPHRGKRRFGASLPICIYPIINQADGVRTQLSAANESLSLQF